VQQQPDQGWSWLQLANSQRWDEGQAAIQTLKALTSSLPRFAEAPNSRAAEQAWRSCAWAS
jgi:hypothetical protein